MIKIIQHSKNKILLPLMKSLCIDSIQKSQDCTCLAFLAQPKFPNELEKNEIENIKSLL